MTHRFGPPLEEQSLELIEAALREANGPATLETLLSVQQFVERIGGIENAYLAVRMLRELEGTEGLSDAA